jgi:hypothetical protein
MVDAWNTWYSSCVCTCHLPQRHLRLWHAVYPMRFERDLTVTIEALGRQCKERCLPKHDSSSVALRISK